MADTTREVCFDVLAEALATITTANGYRNDVVTVDRTIRYPNEVAQTDRPWCAVYPDSERVTTHEHRGMRYIRTTEKIVVQGILQAEPGAPMWKALSDFRDDLIACMYGAAINGAGSGSTSGAGVQVTLQESITGEMAPDSHQSDGATAVIFLYFDLVYDETTQRSV